MNVKRISFELLLIVVIIVLLRNNLKKSSCENVVDGKEMLIRSKYYPDCPSYDPRLNPSNIFQVYFRMINDSSWLRKESINCPSFSQLHQILFGSSQSNIYSNWPNYFQLKIDLSYPFTSLTEFLFEKILDKISIPVRFVVEVGSFQGKSSINMIKTLIRRKKNEESLMLLCIDTWLGSYEHWIDNEQRQLMTMKYGRPIIYEQFLANIILNNLTNNVLPFSTTSIMGGRFLLEKKIFPQMIYLDSSHVQDETFFELQLYWLILQRNGLIFGDDWSWKSVRCDVTRFVQQIQAKLIVISNIWIIQKI